jgi:gp16 family phage-associated protein
MNPQKAQVLTASQARKKIQSTGKTIKQWALDNKYDPNRVYRILGGYEKCHYGIAFNIAVALGMRVRDDGSQIAAEAETERA